MAHSISWLLIVGIALYCCAEVLGHGMLMNPIGRASRWREDPTAPADYNDNQCYCGGSRDKCGVCGDEYSLPTPRPHELGGKYGEGKIVKTFRRGEVIPVAALLTTSHKGHFQFSICPLSGPNDRESTGCFRNLKLGNGESVFKIPSYEKGYYNTTVKLPDDLTCKQCVLRWHYTAGNTWGNCGNGTSGQGCGPQEQFMSCADITIN